MILLYRRSELMRQVVRLLLILALDACLLWLLMDLVVRITGIDWPL
jgi:hypothetical protein